MQKSRITRGKASKVIFPKGKHRQALPDLLRDFDGRCAYSMQYRGKELQVDHFNPRLTGKKKNHYTNLFPATAHCNRSKWDTWPTKADEGAGLRFLNCCEELDYGKHIFEDPITHKVFGITPAGRYHVRYCDLNDSIYILERKNRAEIGKLISDTIATVKHVEASMALVKKLAEIKEKLISDIPFRREGELLLVLEDSEPC